MDRLKKIGSVAACQASLTSPSPIGLGFEKLDRGLFDPEQAYDQVAELGVHWIRIQSGWARTEREAGIYDFAWLDAVVDNLLSRGLQPWICLCYGNELYTPKAVEVFGAVGCPPINSERERRAWHDYVAALTAHFTGRVVWYEIWNEPDGEWCWKHGPDGHEYGEFVTASAAAIRQGDPAAQVIAGSICLDELQWINDVLNTGAGACIDALTYHAYSPDETKGFNRVQALRALCRIYNPEIILIQGETGTQSRSDGAGAMNGGAWTPERQAKFLARHMIADLFDDVFFASYFSCMDMVEALNGTVDDKSSYLDYGYFGVLSADFDENGVATGNYSRKPSYRCLQVIASLFEDRPEHVELPVLLQSGSTRRIMRDEDPRSELLYGGFRKANGASAFLYWRPTELLTTSYESTISLEVAAIEGEARLIDLLDGSIYEIPESMVHNNGCGHRRFEHLPLRDYPLALCFGDFV